MDNIIKQAQVEVFGLTVDVKQVVDDVYDISYLGEFVNNGGPNRFDREAGILYGAKLDSPNEDDYDLNEGEGCFDYDEAYDKWLLYPYEILAHELGCPYERNQYRYFIPANHIPHDDKDWSHVEPDVVRNVVEKHGSPERASISYAAEDWYRAESFGEDWMPTGVVVAIYKDGIELGSSSLWGIESDAEDYIGEVLVDLLWGAVEDAAGGIPKEIESMRIAEIAINTIQATLPGKSEVIVAGILEAFND